MPCISAVARVKALNALPAERPPPGSVARLYLCSGHFQFPTCIARMAPVCGTTLTSACCGLPGPNMWLPAMARAASACQSVRIVV